MKKRFMGSVEHDYSDVKSKMVAKFDVPEEVTNEFIHRNDKRNRHGVSFKAWRNKSDGALLRPKLPSKNADKTTIHTTMLNENNHELHSEQRVKVTKTVMNEFTNREGRLLLIYSILNNSIDETPDVHIVESDIYDQEAALKIRLIKRQNMLKRKGMSNMTLSDESSSTSPSKLRMD